MAGIPLLHALFLLAAVIVIVGATRRQMHPFFAIVIAAVAFGTACGFSLGALGGTFGNGFPSLLYSPGLVIVAAAFVSGIAESTGATDRLTSGIAPWRASLGSTRIASLLGLVAGLAASPASAFAMLTPLLPSLAGSTKRAPAVVSLALSISASHGLLTLSPIPIAAMAILGADWHRVLLFGVPTAILVIALSTALSRWLPTTEAAPESATDDLSGASDGLPDKRLDTRGDGSPSALILAMAIPLVLLTVQSIGDMPSEPLGGGGRRELIIGVGRPLILLVVGIGIMVIGQWRQTRSLFTDPAWTGRILGNVTGVLLIVGAAGGFQALCHATGMAELIGESVLNRHIAGSSGLLVPFLVAAAIKTLQGSSMVAAITAAGMVQPLLLSLGLGTENATALAALAIGAGAMTSSHVNDEYFWLVSVTAGFSPLRGLGTVTLGTLLQGLVALAVLVVLAVIGAGF
jgi:GntP family gluconate:H+ symporter